MLSPFNKRDLLDDLKDEEKFVQEIIFPHYESDASKSYLQFEISEDRLRDAFNLWRRDVDRVQDREYAGGGLDQYKLAGYLCYWLRRQAPITILIAFLTRDVENYRVAQFDGNFLIWLRRCEQTAAACPTPSRP